MITIWDWYERDTPFSERYKLIKEIGFDGVLMWWSNEFGRDSFGVNDYKNAPELARGAGLVIENIHAPVQFANTLWSDNLTGEEQAECCIQCVKDCSIHGISTMVLHLPNDDHPVTAIGIHRFKRLEEVAEQLGINVALENLRNYNSLEFILNRSDSSRVGFCYDSAHHLMHYPDKDLLESFGDRMMAMHLHDNNGSHGQHGLPFDGDSDWHTIMKRISEVGYTGATALETMKWDYEDISSREFLALAYKKARKLEKLRMKTIMDEM